MAIYLTQYYVTTELGCNQSLTTNHLYNLSLGICTQFVLCCVLVLVDSIHISPHDCPVAVKLSPWLPGTSEAIYGLGGLLHSHWVIFFSINVRGATLKSMSKWITWILKDLGPFYWHESTLIPTWISNYIHHEVCNEKTSMVAPLKFGNRYVIHILLGMWLLIHSVIRVNPC